MTNSEATKWLKAIEEKYIHGGDEWHDEQRETAIKVAIEALQNEPIRCKDCKWYGGKMNYPHPYKECTRHHCLSAPNDYCSRAERKEK